MLLRSIDIEGEFASSSCTPVPRGIFAKTGKSEWIGETYNDESKLVVLDMEVANAEPVVLDGEQLRPVVADQHRRR